MVLSAVLAVQSVTPEVSLTLSGRPPGRFLCLTDERSGRPPAEVMFKLKGTLEMAVQPGLNQLSSREKLFQRLSLLAFKVLL